ncbi:MAG: glycosyltransferase [Planctomycetota bacterium]
MSFTVTHFIPDLAASAGGPVTALDNMTRCQIQAGLDVRLTTAQLLAESPGYAANVAEGKVSESELSTAVRTKTTPAERRRIENLIGQSDICHMHGVWEPLQRAVAHAAKRQNCPLFWTPHGLLTDWALGQGRLKKRLYLAMFLRPHLPAHCVQHFASEAERDGTRGLGRLRRSVIVPMGIETHRFGGVHDPSYMEKSHGVTGPTVLFVGRVHPGKGVEHLVAAARQMAPELCTFVIAGPNTSDWAQTIMREAREAGPRFLFTGALPLDEVARALTSATVYCLPSDHENFGMAAAEALAAGAACLLSREVAIAAEAVNAGAARFCRRDPTGLSADLTALLQDAAGRRSLAAAAKEYAKTCYDLSVTVETWKNAYQAML